MNERSKARKEERVEEDARFLKMVDKSRPILNGEGVVVVHVPEFASSLSKSARLGLKIRRHENDDICFEMSYNAFFGVRFVNHLSREDDPQ